MNEQDKQRFRNEIMSRVVHQLSIKRNVINLNTHNSWEHELIKCRICFELKKQGKHFLTEVPVQGTNGKGIADILNLDDAQIIEIRVSETKEQLKNKVRKYPDSIEVVSVRSVNDYFNEYYDVIKEKLI